MSVRKLRGILMITVLSVIGILTVEWLYTPRGFNQVRESAITEFRDFLREYEVDEGLFTGPEVKTDNEGHLTFEWYSKNYDSDWIKVSVSPSRHFFEDPVIIGGGNREALKSLSGTRKK